MNDSDLYETLKYSSVTPGAKEDSTATVASCWLASVGTSTRTARVIAHPRFDPVAMFMNAIADSSGDMLGLWAAFSAYRPAKMASPAVCTATPEKFFEYGA